MKARRLAMALATTLGLAKRGFFIPYRYADRLPATAIREPYAPVAELFAESRPAFDEVLGLIEAVAGDLAAIGGAPPPAPRWDQDWFPCLDAAVAYALVRAHRPRRIVEVGSGHSTRFLARAIADGGLETVLAAVDPAPRANLEGLPIDFIRATVQEAGATPFADLVPGDMLAIDSSHILVPGSDVDFLLNRVLPEVPAGVFIHFHDIFLPDGYPPSWEWRGYNEQQAVCPLLLSGAHQMVFASHYARHAMADTLAGTVVGRLPLVTGAHESSLWLRKTA
jgi:hypothetical protein